ncbi:hypothetical protein [Gimesia panareensis]|uniref:Uncharacterized protein n=1 Tax=Gimesia panareensis TaxID=2527978 RepID=A0A518A307_9PLAN|nr:hypothetical protein [Gimesia panareensis]QDU49114.1 hypothetical protein Pan110_14330 [Gimesia panareensis]QDV17667.1 hypothetical protein Pan153_23200 [Gimesia panareensis]
MSQITSSTYLPETVSEQPETVTGRFRESLRSAWLVDPKFDLLFLVNLGWPLLVLWQWLGGLEIQSGISFWQVYFITTPHRWITPALLFLDRDRLQANKTKYILITVCLLTIPLAVKISTGALTCLLTIDYIWNAWHFAAQHHGIYSIYGRKTGGISPRRARIDKWLMRTFLLYVTLRIASWASWGSATPGWSLLDSLFATIPVGMMLREFWQLRAETVGRCLYFTSVMTLYLSMLGAVVARNPMLLLVLTTASALFHSIEYLAIVSWAVDRTGKSGQSTTELFKRLMPRWGIILAVFIVILGMGAWLMETHLMELWLTANLIMAFLHYAYDGLIWKSRRAVTA